MTAGRATGRPIPPPSDEDLRRAEEAWNDSAFYEFVKDEGFVGAGWVPKPAVDPNRSLIPTQEEMEELPRWARVAFAARCARRVMPVYQFAWPRSPLTHVQAVERAVATAEETSRTARRVVLSHAAAADTIYADAALAARAPALAAAYAARAAQGAYSVAASEDEYSLGGIAEVIDDAVLALTRSVTVGAVSHVAALARDFDRLVRLTEEERWTDNTPVPPSVFGPMWEGTPPEWWTDDILAGEMAEPTGA